MLETFLARKWSYLLPALVAVGAWRGRAGTVTGMCISPPKCHISKHSTAVMFWGTKGGTAAQELHKLDVFK